jgi:translation initiation factor IF-2
MSETSDKPKLGARAPLGLKRTVETGKVKQSFSHGRSNTVVVEVKKRRILGPGGSQPERRRSRKRRSRPLRRRPSRVRRNRLRSVRPSAPSTIRPRAASCRSACSARPTKPA